MTRKLSRTWLYLKWLEIWTVCIPKIGNHQYFFRLGPLRIWWKFRNMKNRRDKFFHTKLKPNGPVKSEFEWKFELSKTQSCAQKSWEADSKRIMIRGNQFKLIWLFMLLQTILILITIWFWLLRLNFGLFIIFLIKCFFINF